MNKMMKKPKPMDKPKTPSMMFKKPSETKMPMRGQRTMKNKAKK